MTDPFYNEGSRRMQDRFDSRRLADRLEQVTLRRAFTDEDRAFITRAAMFFLQRRMPTGIRTALIKAECPASCRSSTM